MSLNTAPTPTSDLHQAVQLKLQGIHKFQVELLDERGKSLSLQSVDVPTDSEAVKTTISVPGKGAYQVRSSAFTRNDAILGTTSQAVQLQSEDNQLTVDTLGLSNLYYAQHADLPQTKSASALEKFLSYDQPGITLQAYCFFGYL